MIVSIIVGTEKVSFMKEGGNGGVFCDEQIIPVRKNHGMSSKTN